MRVLVFGGSFDPPHRGHSALLNASVERIRPDRILIVPAYHAPMKGKAPAPAKDRVELVKRGLLDKLPAKWRKVAKVDLTEVSSKRPVYTYETLRRLEGELHFVVGQDSAENFHRWKKSARLRRLASWWYGGRAGTKGRAPDHFRLVPGRFLDISSTELRSSLSLDQDCSEHLFPAVLSHIQSRRMYGLDRLALLRSSLSPFRYEHTLNVATLAESLARRWGADPDKARTAGLLHDAGRRFAPPVLAAYARRRRLQVPEREHILRSDPMLLHAYASEDLATTEFGVTDRETLDAIRRHTLGDARMTLLDKVLYVADACSADRTHPGVVKTRALAYADLDAALRVCVAEKLRHALSREAWLHPLTISLWNSLASL